ncbi:hypothetical protein ACJ41O_010129 [Fusarium nematophilum]
MDTPKDSGGPVDQNDTCSPLTSYWDKHSVKRHDAKNWLWTLAFPREKFAPFKMSQEPSKRFFFKSSSVPGLEISIKPPNTAEDAGQEDSPEKA